MGDHRCTHRNKDGSYTAKSWMDNEPPRLKEAAHIARYLKLAFLAVVTRALCAGGGLGPGVHMCAGKDRRINLLPCPCGRGATSRR